MLTDNQGRFEVPEFAAGELYVESKPDITSPWYLPTQKGNKTEAGRTTEVEVPLARAIPVKGEVREKGTGKPIAGVDVAADYVGEGTVKTDESGRFTGFSRPGKCRFPVRRVPASHATLMYGPQDVTIPDDATEFTVPPIELSRAGVVRGLVVDPEGKPVAGAEVEVFWQVDEGPGRQGRRETSVLSGPDGRFVVHQVTADTPVELSARLAGLRTTQAATSRADAPEIVRLRLDETATVAMEGRVLGAGGPLPRAQVHLRVQKRYPSGQVQGDELVEFERSLVLITDKDGRFRTPKELAGDGEYAAYATMEGFGPGRTSWTSAGSGSFADLVLEPETGTRSVEGMVRDRTGRPIADVMVWSSEAPPVWCGRMSSGRFRLADLQEGRGFLFVRKAGYRFAGRVIEPGVKSLVLVLSLTGELPARHLKTLPPPLPHAEAIKLARHLLEPRMSRILKEGDPRIKNAFVLGRGSH